MEKTHRVEVYFANGEKASFSVIDLDIFHGNGERIRMALSETEVVYVPNTNVNYFKVIKNV